MSDSKVLGFSIKVDGISNEANELAKIQLQLAAIKKERAELIKQASAPGHFTSNEERQKLAAYNKEIGVQEAALKTLKRVVDSASDSLARKKALLIELTEKSNKATAAIAAGMAPAIKKLNDEIKNGEEARGVFTRNVGNYPGIMGKFTESLEAASTASAKGGISFKQAFTQLAAGGAIVATLTALFAGIKEAIMSTTFAIDLMNKVGAISKKMFYDLAINGKLSIDNLANASKIQGELNKLRIEEGFETLKLSKINREEQEVRELSGDRTKTHAERLVYLT